MSQIDLAESLKEKGNESFKAGDYEEAVLKYTQSLQLDSQNVLVYSNRSLAYSKLTKYRLALQDAEECVKVRPHWAKGYLRKAVAFEGLGQDKDVTVASTAGFKLTADNKMKRDFVSLWHSARQRLNQLPDNVELPRGICVLSGEYKNVLAYLFMSLEGVQPLTQHLAEQCLSSCAEQIKVVLEEFGESHSEVILQCARYLAQEVYPYSTNPTGKSKLAKLLLESMDLFVKFFEKEVDPTLYVVIRPIFGLMVSVVLNRTNILCETNTGHHSAELINTSVLKLFECSILNTPEYHSMYVGRLCAVLDSFIGRGYKLTSDEIVTVCTYYKKLENAMVQYPLHLPEIKADRIRAKTILSNVRGNVLEPAQLTPPSVPTEGLMNVEVAGQLVKERPEEVKRFIEKRTIEIESTQFLSMRDVEDLLQMTSIHFDLGDKESALKIFRFGEQAFFTVLGHLLSTSALKLDQCSAAITPIRQLVFTQAALLDSPSLFADVTVRWKCLFTELRRQLIEQGLGSMFGDIFQWYKSEKSASGTLSDEHTSQILSEHMEKEEAFLKKFAAPTLKLISKQNHKDVIDKLDVGAIVLDYIFFATTQANPLLDAYCVIMTNGNMPTLQRLDYAAIHRLSPVIKHFLSQLVTKNAEGDIIVSESVSARVMTELSHLMSILIPSELVSKLQGTVSHIYFCPDVDITVLPIDVIPLANYLPSLSESTSLTMISSSRELIRLKSETPPDSIGTCCIVADPNYDMKKPSEQMSLLQNLVGVFSSYLNVSTTSCVDPLPCSKLEAADVAASLQSAGIAVKTMLQNDANLTNVLAIKRPQVLHISSHAFAPASRSTFRHNFWSDLNSCIALAGYNTYASEKFSQLHLDGGIGQIPALAVCSMDLRGTHLVFLSTCSSAIGDSLSQETVSSLVEAFQEAGAETVIATLWPVVDSIASELCKHFYAGLVVKGTRPSHALQLAKEKLRSKYGSLFLFYWGSFVCYGLDRPLV